MKKRTRVLSFFLVLIYKRIFWSGQYACKRIFVKVGEGNDYRNSSDKLGNKSVFDDIVSDNVLIYSALYALLFCLF